MRAASERTTYVWASYFCVGLLLCGLLPGGLLLCGLLPCGLLLCGLLLCGLLLGGLHLYGLLRTINLYCGRSICTADYRRRKSTKKNTWKICCRCLVVAVVFTTGMLSFLSYSSCPRNNYFSVTVLVPEIIIFQLQFLSPK